MTDLAVPDASELRMLEQIVNKTAAQDLKLCLFKNNHVPAYGDTIADYLEATFTGYAEIALAGASWTSVAGSNTTPSAVTYAEQTFTSSANQTAQTIYGYYVKETTSGLIKWAQLLDAATTISKNTDVIKVTPRFELNSKA